jgi:hypothetical protein
MPHVYVDVYAGDPCEFIRDASGDHEVGEKTVDAFVYTDGEEFEAAMKVIDLLKDGTHFDVRNEVN